MSIQSEITRLSDARAALDAAIAAKGVQVPGSARLGDLPALIAAILTQKPEQSKTVSPALAQQMVTPDAGKTLFGVTVEAVTKELLAALDQMADGTAVWVEQDESKVTYAKKIEKAEMLLDPAATALDNRRRVQTSLDAAPARMAVADVRR